MVHTRKLRDTGGTWIGEELIELSHEEPPNRFGECPKLLLGRRGQQNSGDCSVQLESQFLQNDIK
jgi:hypothetical protein